MNNKNVKLPGFVIWLAQNNQLDEAFRIIRRLDTDEDNPEPDEEAKAQLQELYAPYRDSFGEAEAPTFDKAVSGAVEVWCRLVAPTDANVSVNDRDADSDGDEDEKPEMNAEAKAELQEKLLMLIECHNDAVKTLRSKNVKFDAIGVQWVLSVLLKLMNAGTLISHMARLYGISAECVHGKGNILVDWDEVCKDDRLAKHFLTEEDLSEDEPDEPENDPEDGESDD